MLRLLLTSEFDFFFRRMHFSNKANSINFAYANNIHFILFIRQVVLWILWYAVQGFLILLSQLCKERFEYVSV